MIRGGYLIYQDIADPLRPEPPPETITVDKWYKEHPRPILRKMLSTAVVVSAVTTLVEFNTPVIPMVYQLSALGVG